MQEFNRYMQSLPLHEEYKKYILDDNFMNDNPKWYQNYPSLFSGFFTVGKEQLKMLDIAGYLYYQATLHTDSLVDKKDISKLPLMSVCQEESIKILTSIYGLEHDFWKLWNRRRNEYFEAVVFEKALSKKENVTMEDYKTLADTKSAFGKVAIDCLFSIDNANEEVYKRLLLSHKCFSVGFQLYDDIKDFKEDFINNQFNWAIHELKKIVDFDQFKNSCETLNKLLYIKGIGQNILSLSIEYFQKSIAIISSLEKDSEWLKINIEMKETIENYLEVTNGYIGTIAKKIEIENTKNTDSNFFDFTPIDNLNVSLGLEFIKKNFEKNYSELKHYMYFIKNEEFERSNIVHYSDTFQRAMLNDCLLTIKEKYNINTFDFFDLECNYLIEKANKDAVRAWSYFPSVQEIAADIDDLGQIMQLFINHNRLDLIEKHCLVAINVALTDRTCKNGGIETWIIPKENQNEIQTKQEYFNTTKWGCGPDLEVVANFIFALQKYNSAKYKENITNAIHYIISCQSKEGFWDSRWYYGAFYGTYVCLRLLKEFENEYSTSINLALNYVLESQNEDGGFGLVKSEKSDALSTSFTLLVLKMYPKNNREPIIKAVDYLIKSQDKLGYWNEIDFIKPRQQEPYKSKTLTTAFVLKALC